MRLSLVLASLLLAGCGGVASSNKPGARAKSSTPGACITQSDCGANQYCKFASSDAQCGLFADGVCTDVEFACPHICTAVCGCDGVTYDNYCFAHKGGTDVAFSGFCRQAPKVACWPTHENHCNWATAQADCNPNGNGASNAGAVGDSNLYCATSAVCVVIPPNCDDFSPVIGLDGNSYDTECDAYWNGRVPPACHWTSGPVCGTNGQTYSSECDAFLSHQPYIIGSNGC
jgi:hypothetical protein